MDRRRGTATARRSCAGASPHLRALGGRLIGTAIVVLLLSFGLTAPASAQTEPPNVLGLSLDAAITTIQQDWYPDSGIVPKVSWTPEIPATVSRDAVFVLDIADVFYLEDSDDANPSASITFVVGTIVPDLSQLTSSEAEGIVTDLGFGLDPTGDESGVVVGQSPEPDVPAPFGSRIVVTLEVSPPQTAFVPDLIGLSEAAAASQVAEVRLALAVTSRSGSEPFQVAAQDPAPGTELALGTPVEVVLAGASNTVEVPDLTGATADQVEQTLTDLSLVLLVDPRGDGRRGVAARQDPAAGSIVEPGSAVTVAFAVPITPTDDGGFPWVRAGIGAGALLLVGGAYGLLRRTRPRSRPRPSRPIRVQGRPDQRPDVSARHASGPAGGSDVAISVRPHASAGKTVLKELP
jgi:hypothetical protein